MLKAIFNINRPMYVCLCLGVTEEDIQDTIAEGAATVEEVTYCTGAGSRCGSCRSTIAAMLEDAEATPSGRRVLPVLTSAA
jgi:bacterioferritin-associated ferredoxin